MNVVLKDDFNFSENESEYFSGTDDDSENSVDEISDSVYEGDAESNSFDELEVNSESSNYEQSVNDIIDDILFELKGDCDSEDSDAELEIYKEIGGDVEVINEEIREYSEDSDFNDSSDSFDDSDSDYDEEFISFVIKNTKYHLKKIMMALTPMVMRKF